MDEQQQPVTAKNAQMTEDQRTTQRLQNRERARKRRARMTDEQRDAERAANRARYQRRMAQMSEEEQVQRRLNNRINARRRRQTNSRTPMQLQATETQPRSTVDTSIPTQHIPTSSQANRDPMQMQGAQTQTRSSGLPSIPSQQISGSSWGSSSEIDEIYNLSISMPTSISWDDWPRPDYVYNDIRVVIPRVPRHLPPVEQWNFIFRAFAKSTTFRIPKSYNMTALRQQLRK